MKILRGLLPAALVGWFVIPAVLPAAEPPPHQKPTLQDVIHNAKKTFQSIKSYTYEQKDEYQKKLQQTLNQIDEQIPVLKEKVDQATGRLQKRYRRQLARLEKLRAQAGERLQKVKDATPATWDELKKGAGDVLKNLGQALEQAGNWIRR